MSPSFEIFQLLKDQHIFSWFQSLQTCSPIETIPPPTSSPNGFSSSESCATKCHSGKHKDIKKRIEHENWWKHRNPGGTKCQHKTRLKYLWDMWELSIVRISMYFVSFHVSKETKNYLSNSVFVSLWVVLVSTRKVYPLQIFLRCPSFEGPCRWRKRRFRQHRLQTDFPHQNPEM